MLYNINLILNNAPQPWQISFQDSAAPVFSGIVELHSTIIELILTITPDFIFTFTSNNLVLFSCSIFLLFPSLLILYSSKKLWDRGSKLGSMVGGLAGLIQIGDRFFPQQGNNNPAPGNNTPTPSSSSTNNLIPNPNPNSSPKPANNQAGQLRSQTSDIGGANACSLLGLINTNNYLTNKKINHSFLFPFIIGNLDVGVLDNSVAQLAYSVLLLSLVALFCLINIIIYGLGYYFSKETKYNDVNKYPFVSKIIKRYSTVTLFSIAIETVLCFMAILSLVGSSIYILYSVTTITWKG